MSKGLQLAFLQPLFSHLFQLSGFVLELQYVRRVFAKSYMHTTLEDKLFSTQGIVQ